jgi:hypothetical protein
MYVKLKDFEFVFEFIDDSIVVESFPFAFFYEYFFKFVRLTFEIVRVKELLPKVVKPSRMKFFPSCSADETILAMIKIIVVEFKNN